MITKKLMHDIQSWLNTLYDFKNKDNDRNKLIVSHLENFCFKLIYVRIAIWVLGTNNDLHHMIQNYDTYIRNEEEFEKFKTHINNTIEEYIKAAIETTNEIEQYGD